MKTSIPLQLSILCTFVFSILCSFQLGVHYAAKPYRALIASAPSRIEFMQIGVQQSHTLMFVSFAAFGFSLLGVGLLFFAHMRKEVPIQSATAQRS